MGKAFYIILISTFMLGSHLFAEPTFFASYTYGKSLIKDSSLDSKSFVQGFEIKSQINFANKYQVSVLHNWASGSFSDESKNELSFKETMLAFKQTIYQGHSTQLLNNGNLGVGIGIYEKSLTINDKEYSNTHIPLLITAKAEIKRNVDIEFTGYGPIENIDSFRTGELKLKFNLANGSVISTSY